MKTKRYLRTKSNISLACLATTDFAVGLIVQPLVITNFNLFFIGSSPQTMTSTFIWVFSAIGQTCIAASLLHLLLMSGERYLAIKHPFAYENGLVTEARIIMASGLAWMCAAIVCGIRARHLSRSKCCFYLSRYLHCSLLSCCHIQRSSSQHTANHR